MKKVLALVMCIAMIASFVVTASADVRPLTLTASSVEVEGEVGEVFTIEFSLSEKSEVGSLQFFVTLPECIEPTTQKNDREKDVYFMGGDAAIDAGATAEGSDGLVPMDEADETSQKVCKFAAATTAGFWKAGAVYKAFFKVVSEIPEEGAVIDILDDTVAVKIAEGEDTYDVTVEDGLVTVKEEIIVPPVIDDPTATEPTGNEPNGGEDNKGEDNKGEDNKGEDNETEIPATGDASAIAVAAGLCAVMAAAFVLTKKVND